jgi:hypothetical protein
MLERPAHRWMRVRRAAYMSECQLCSIRPRALTHNEPQSAEASLATTSI